MWAAEGSRPHLVLLSSRIKVRREESFKEAAAASKRLAQEMAAGKAPRAEWPSRVCKKRAKLAGELQEGLRQGEGKMAQRAQGYHGRKQGAGNG